MAESKEELKSLLVNVKEERRVKWKSSEPSPDRECAGPHAASTSAKKPGPPPGPPTRLAPGACGLLLLRSCCCWWGAPQGPSAGTVRISRGPWTLRTLGMMTPSLMMSWTTSTPGLALATLSSSQALRQPCGSAQMLPWQCPPHPLCCPPWTSSLWAPSLMSSLWAPHPEASHQPPTGDRGARAQLESHHHLHSYSYHHWHTTGAPTVATVPATVATAIPSISAAPPSWPPPLS